MNTAKNLTKLVFTSLVIMASASGLQAQEQPYYSSETIQGILLPDGSRATVEVGVTITQPEAPEPSYHLFCVYSDAYGKGFQTEYFQARTYLQPGYLCWANHHGFAVDGIIEALPVDNHY